MRRSWRTVAIITLLTLLGAACGSSDPEQQVSGESSTTSSTVPDSTVPTTTEAASNTVPPSTVPTTTAAASTTTTTAISTTPPQDPPVIANPDRPWVVEARDELMTRSGLGFDAANCIFELTESEGFDARHLIWGDNATPIVIQAAVGQCGSFIDGPFDLPSGDTPPDDYGDHPELDLYWEWCEAGDGVACDVLWFDSPSDTAYETFGDTCGARADDTSCVDLLGIDAPGESPFLDRALSSCRDGYASSCDDLTFYTDTGEYHRLGETCADRIPAEPDPDCGAAIAEQG